MKNVIGQVARGDDFFPRKKEMRKIEKTIKSGSHMQLSAPRRVGKTSILMRFFDQGLEGCEFVFLNTEAIYNEGDFFKKIVQEVIKCKCINGSKKVIHQLKGGGNAILKLLKSVDFGGNGLELNDVEGVDYFKEFINLIKGIDVEKKIIIMIDEFPHTILNILGKDNEGKEKAIKFLHSNRTLRLDKDIYGKVQFIYTGSIGLNTTVAKIDASHLINDVPPVPVGALSKEEAKNLIDEILIDLDIIISDEVKEYIFDKIKWLIPFYLKLIIKEADDLMDMVEKTNEVSNSIIDEAFDEVLNYRNNNYFEHYHSRLKMYYSGEALQSVIQILNFIAKNEDSSKSQLYDLAVKYNQGSEFSNVLQTLKYDGYIYSNESGDGINFNSPILKMWWVRNVCI